MELVKAKEQFIEAWGALGTQWGINRAMAQIHALLLISTNPLSTEDIMKELSMSRGNANMNIRTLIEWRLVSRRLVLGERKEFFEAEKDIWIVFTRIVYERRKRELDPLRKLLQELKTMENKSALSSEEHSFLQVINELDAFSDKADKVLQKAIAAEKSWLYTAMKNVMKIGLTVEKKK